MKREKISFYHLNAIKARIEKLDRKITKGLGCAVDKDGNPVSSLLDLLTISDPYTMEVLVSSGSSYDQYMHSILNEYTKRTVIDIEFSGSFQPSKDYDLIATLEPSIGGENYIRKVMNDVEIPVEYRETNNCCEHCNTNRQRNKYFLVQEKATGKFMQVGSSCIQHMFPITDAEITRFMSAVTSVCEDDYTGGRAVPAEYPLKMIVGLALNYIKEHGFVSRTAANNNYDYDCDCPAPTTGEIIMSCLKGGEGSFTEEEIIAGIKSGEPVLEFAESMSGDSDYVHNVKLLCKMEIIPKFSIGLAVSIAQCYIKDLEKKALQGKVGDVANDQEVPVGRHEVSGIILSTKIVESMYGATEKMLVQCDGFKLYGSVPKAIDGVGAGDEITFTGTLESKETGFGFFKRPSKASVKKQQEAA